MHQDIYSSIKLLFNIFASVHALSKASDLFVVSLMHLLLEETTAFSNAIIATVS